MKAAVWHGRRDVRVDDVADPTIEAPTDAIIEVTSTGLCGSDLHLYEVMAPFMTEGDILGHEPMGIVEAVGLGGRRPAGRRPSRRAVQHRLRPLLHVRRAACSRSARRRRSATRAAAPRCSATPSCTAQCRAGRPQYLRVPQAHYGPIKVPDGPPDDRFVYLSDVLPTAWQAVEYAAIPPGGSVVVLGLGPIGDMAARIARHRGADTVIGVDLVPERLERARARGVDVIDISDDVDLADAVRDATGRTWAPTPSSTPSAWRPTAHRRRRRPTR